MSAKLILLYRSHISVEFYTGLGVLMCATSFESG